MNPRTAYQRRLGLLALLGLAGIYLLAPWPGPQAVVHAFVVLGIASVLRTYLSCVILAAGAGWALEIFLRGYPGMGGTPLANMVCALLFWYSLSISPPGKPLTYYFQLALVVILHAFMTYFLVNVAAGSHVMGNGWQWTLVILPFWGPLAWRLYKPPHMR